MTDLLHYPLGPQRIVCLTEETTEWLYLLGQEQRIVGISGYTVRPKRARDEKPRVSAFLSAKIEKIMELQPDCVLGFSDLQADIASDLVKRGVQVTIFNQRSVAEIFSMLYQLAAMVGEAEQGAQRIAQMQADLRAMQAAAVAKVAKGRGGPRCILKNGTARTSARSAGCPSWSASRGATIAFLNSPPSRWARTASLPTVARSSAATRTLFWAPGAARNSGPRTWWRVKAGVR